MEECIQVKIELGHKACLRAKKTTDGFTHDWTVFVRGSEGCNIQHFVERVVFHLHESFPKPKRVVKEPPYQVCESGYAGFMVPIEVHFKNKEEPKKVFFEYDLFLQLEGPPLSKFRVEKLTFNNPTEDFKRKVFQAGGVGILGSEGGTNVLNSLQKHSPGPSTHCSSQSKPTKHFSEAIKAPKSSTFSTAAVPTVNTAQSNTKEIKSAAALQPPQAFVDLFGQPIKANKASPDPQKAKDLHSKIPGKSNKPPTASSCSSELHSNNSNGTKDSKSSVSKETKDLKDSKKEKGALKRPLSPILQAGDSSHTKKRKIVPSGSSSSVKVKDGKEKKKSEKKSSSKDQDKKEKREKHKHSNDSGSVAAKHLTGKRNVLEAKPNKEIDVNAKVSKKPKHTPSTSPSLSNSSESSETTKSSRSFKVSPPSPQLVEESPEPMDESPSSSISLSPMHPSRRNGPLGALIAAYEGRGIISPFGSPRSGSPTHPLEDEEQMVPDIHVQPPIPVPQSPPPPPKPSLIVITEKIEKSRSKDEKTAGKEDKSSSNKDKPKKNRHRSEKYSITNSDSKKASSITTQEQVLHETSPESISDEYAMELKELQRQIVTLHDRQHLQQIVNVIEETGLYKVTSTTFDFDLCRLDRGTVIKLQNFLAAVS